MKRRAKFKPVPTKQDIDVRKSQRDQNFEQIKKPALIEKINKLHKHYTDKLYSMVDDTLSLITNETPKEELESYLNIGDKEWKSICSSARQTIGKEIHKYIPISPGLYTETVLVNLKHRGVITEVSDDNRSEESGEAKEIVLDDIKTDQVDSINEDDGSHELLNEGGIGSNDLENNLQ